ncbi:NlpC/P60 family protein [Micromonospora sp. NPDC047074]|uniref:C40 family peptidase n=1 Tax=Micromonospora sp. NPDC047074 TaxID=3154339 RepID=UPI0033C20262
MLHRSLPRLFGRLSLAASVAVAGALAVPATAAQADLSNPSITLEVGCGGAQADIEVRWLSAQKMNIFWRAEDTKSDGKTPVLRIAALNPSGSDDYVFVQSDSTSLKVTGGVGSVKSGHIYDWNPSIASVLALEITVRNGTADQGTACESVKKVRNYAQNALRYAETRIGDPYVFGAEGPGSFDCSGLVWWSFNQVSNFPGFSGNRSALQMYNWVRDMAADNADTPWRSVDAIKVSAGDVQAGDLIFYNQPASWDADPIDHVGFYAGDGKVLDAQRARGVSQHTENLGSYIVARYRIVGVIQD